MMISETRAGIFEHVLWAQRLSFWPIGSAHPFHRIAAFDGGEPWSIW